MTFLLLSTFLWTGKALSFETSAKAAYILDQTTGTVLLEKNADQPLPPASMSKLMTLYMAFEYINQGRLELTEKLPVSDAAVEYRGSTMFLNTSDRVTVEDLLRGIIVLSGNDACVVLAEALSPDGTEKGFADLMTRRAKKMGIKDIDKKLMMDDLVKGNRAMFAATGVTDGTILRGVRYTGTGAITHSIVMRAKTKTVRFIEAHHNFEYKPLKF